MLKELNFEIENCRKCELHATCTNKVLGAGNPNASVVIVGEAPGAEEDATGIPFCGDSGMLLTKYIRAIGLSRDEVFICNVLKCRPPGNRNPEPLEIQFCSPFLFRQLEIIKPKVIVTVGAFPSQTILKAVTPISKLRGTTNKHGDAVVIPTYHPSFLLRSPSMKPEAWKDWQKVMKLVEQL